MSNDRGHQTRRVVVPALAIYWFSAEGSATGVFFAALAAGGILGALSANVFGWLHQGKLYLAVTIVLWPALLHNGHHFALTAAVLAVIGYLESLPTATFLAEIQRRLPLDELVT